MCNKERMHNKKTYQCETCQKYFQRRIDQHKQSLLKWNKIICSPCAYKFAGENKRGKYHISPELRVKLIAGRTKYPNLSMECKFCHNTFTFPYAQQNKREYCSRVCQVKGVCLHTDIRKKTICLICKTEFLHYGERILCSQECMAKYFSIVRIGENNPAAKACIKETKTCLYCKNPFTFNRRGLHAGQTRTFCSLACAHSKDVKGLNLGQRKSPYPREWRKTKEIIRKRDGGLCALCGLDQKEQPHKHAVHHIDYNTQNLDHKNLITLCQVCHNTTHNGRTFWEIIFSALMSGSKIVKKGWGAEIHITNNSSYCLKYLIFFKGKEFSYHIHNLKKELWHCLWGKFECILGNNDKKDYFIFEQGDKIELDPKTPHQLRALKNCIITEVSTTDYPEDSIRITKGD